MSVSDKIDIAIIAADRELMTLDYTITSLRKFIPDAHLTIFAEPMHLDIKGGNFRILVNRERMGALQNFDRALTWILKNGTKPYLWITEDDYAYNSTIVPRLEEATGREGFGYYNMFTNYWNPSLPNPVPEGWVNHTFGYYEAWGMSYLMTREGARAMQSHECYQHYLATTVKNIDGVVSETFKRMGLPMFLHNPSPSCSASVVSTLGHEHQTDGLHFKINA